MNKQNYLIIGVLVVVLAAAIIVLASMKQDGAKAPKGDENANTPSETEIVTKSGEKIEDLTNPGKAIDSGELSEEQLANIPVSEETILKYGTNGLETKVIKAKAGERVFITFSASDNGQHLLTFTDPKMESVLVMFSKEEGDKSINFLSPGVGSYEFTIDGKEKGALIIE